MPTQAFVGSDDGERFDAHVELDEPGPFSLLNGPRGVSADLAVDWARSHAQRVLVRLRDALYSAGAERLPALVPWPERPRAGSAPARAPSHPGRWQVQATTAWHRGDAETVAAAMLRELRRDARAREARAAGSAARLELAFAVRCDGELEAQARASEILRAAWERLAIAAMPGRDYDISTIEVVPA